VLVEGRCPSRRDPNHPKPRHKQVLAGHQKKLKYRFDNHHIKLTLRVGQLPSNTSVRDPRRPTSFLPPLVSGKEQPVKHETSQGEEPARTFAQPASLAVPRVSVKSRVAAFEKKSPTASIFSPSPPREGKVDLVSRGLSTDPKQEESRALFDITEDLVVTLSDPSQISFSGCPPSFQRKTTRVFPSGFGFPPPIITGIREKVSPPFANSQYLTYTTNSYSKGLQATKGTTKPSIFSHNTFLTELTVLARNRALTYHCFFTR
jgi:hypothetical protein